MVTCLLLMVIMLLIPKISCEVKVSFLEGAPQLNNSMYWDYYFACQAEGETLQWIVNNNSVSDYMGQTVGHVFSQSISNCRYVSTLISLMPSSQGQSIFESVLIVSCLGNSNLDVVCTNVSISRTDLNQGLFSMAERNTISVNMKYVWSQNFANTEDSSCTRIFICGVNDSMMIWQVNNFEPLRLFTFDMVGKARQTMQDSILKQQVILIGKEPYSLVGILVVIDSGPVNVACGYNQNMANFSDLLCSPSSTTTESTSITQNATSERATGSINIAIIIGSVLGSVVLLLLSILLILIPCFIFLYLWQKKRIEDRIEARRTTLGGNTIGENGRLSQGGANNTVNQIELENLADDNENGEDGQNIQPNIEQNSIGANDHAEDDNDHAEDDNDHAEDDTDDIVYLTPTRVDVFTKKFRNIEASDITKEFEILKNVTRSSESCSDADRDENKGKNRFNEFVPYNSSRVKLGNDEGYINASFIKGYDGMEKAYIAAQQPMSNTKVDFWQMIYEQRVTTIVMFRETGQWNDMQYWPNEEMTENQNGTNLQVTHEKEECFVDFDVRTFTIKHGNDTLSSIKHYFFKDWHNRRKIPQFSATLIQFICHIKSKRAQDDHSPIVVHSKAGIGRTGVFIALYGLMEQMKEDQEIGIFKFVKSIRLSRKSLVGYMSHYLFIYKALNELCISGDTSLMAAEELRERLNEVDITKEFELLSSVGRLPIRSEQSDAFNNRSKNSCISSLPYNSTRVKLASTGNNYISACFVNGYKTTHAYIAAQIPLKETKEDLWNMIWEQGSQTIVLLGPMQERNMRFSKFWPRRSQKYGTMTVTLDSEDQIHQHKERIILISKDNEIQKVTFYHYENWLEHEQPESTDGIRQLIERLKGQQDQRDRKVVMCSDGAGRTGAFITICETIEMFHEVEYVDFFKLIVLLRIDRADLVREVEHYKFCHTVLADYIDQNPYAN